MAGYLELSGAFETAAYVPAGTRAVGIQLGVRVESDPLDPVADGKAVFEHYLRRLSGLRFAAYGYVSAQDPADPNRKELRLRQQLGDADGWLPPIGPAPEDRSAEIMGWLEARTSTWNSKPTVAEEIEPARLDASQLLGSAQTWIAPLPQRAGLTRILRLGDDGSADRIVVVPFTDADAGEAPPDSLPAAEIEENGNAGYVIMSQGNGGSGRRVFEIAQPADQSLLVDAQTGFLKVPPDADKTHVLLRRIRDELANALWAAPQLMEWGIELDPPTGQNPALDLRAKIVWRGMSALAALLDPLLLALTMAGSPREGPFVAALLEANAGELDDDELDGAEVTESLSKKILDRVRNPEATPAARQDFAGLLAEILGVAIPELPVATGAEEEDRLAPVEGALPLVLKLFRDGPALARPFTDLHFLNRFDRRIDQELVEAADRLQMESTLERAVLILLTPAAVAHWGEDKGLRFIEALRQRMAGPFDGVTASRQAVGEMMQSAILDRARAAAPRPADPHALPGFADHVRALRKGRWLTQRLGLSDGGSFEVIAKDLPRLDPAALSAVECAALTRRLAQAELRIVAELAAGIAEDGTRFRTDGEPRPLAIPIGVDQDTSDGDGFSLQYDGIGVLIRRGAEPWAHGNLAKITRPLDAGPELTLLPLQPAETDGQRQLHLEYRGFPFAAGNLGPADPDATPASLSYYSYKEPLRGDLGARQSLYALAFGHDYEVAAFAVSRSGALPDGIGEPGRPWVPLDNPVVPPPNGTVYTQKIAYRRTTPVGAAAWERAPDGRDDASASRPKVKTLADDYPRLAHGAGLGTTAVFDLWRGSDGRGAVALPDDGTTISLRLTDVRALAGPGALGLALLDDPTAVFDAFRAQWEVTIPGAFEDGELQLDIKRVGPRLECSLKLPSGSWTTAATAALPMPLPSRPLWLRARLQGAAQAVALSFADPSPRRREDTAPGAVAQSGFVLLAPPAGAVWRDEFHSATTMRLTFPRMTFAEFDRWVANPELLRRADPNGHGLVTVLHRRLLAAHIDAGLAKDIEDCLKCIPDLAVHRMLVELRPLDGLTADGAAGETQLGALLSEDEVRVQPLGDILHSMQEDAAKPISIESGPLREILRALDIHYSRTAEIACVERGSPLGIGRPSGRTLPVAMAGGTVARLSVSRLVDRDLIDAGSRAAAFDPRMKELATGLRGDCYIFDGPALTIEAMTLPPDAAPWSQLASRAGGIRARPSGVSRAYDLVSGDSRVPVDPDWRHLGAIEVTSQRWRPTGRPIYNWIDPKAAGSYVEGCPVVQLPESASLDRFEKEAFFDRDPADAETADPKELEPAGSETVLMSVPWEKPSATLFRHRFALFSRYRPALKDPNAGRYEVNREGLGLGAWMRVAMLADAAGVQLVRPQLRALLPLTASAERAGTPPILAMLEEPPFGYGGLAERISAEVRTSYGYGFAGEVLGVNDARKEFGPDPRLTLDPAAGDAASTVAFGIEGPIGLTFDGATTSAPAMPNSAYILTPRLLDDAPDELLEEHFLGASLRRYLDPAWVNAPLRPLDLATAAWLPTSRGARLEVGNRLIVEIVKGDSHWEISAARDAILPKSSTNGTVTIARVARSHAQSLVLVHQPLEEGRFAATILALPVRRGAIGDAVFPRAVASLEWATAPAADGALTFTELPGDGLMASLLSKAPPALASPLTTMNWTRTGRDNRFIQAWTTPGPGALTRADVGHLAIVGKSRTPVAAIREGAVTLSPRSSLLGAPDPLFVHRHLALLLTDQAGGAGQPLEIFSSTQLLIGRDVLANGLSGRHRARLIELETPARPLAAGTPVTEFQEATFDLKAIVREDNASSADSLTFFIRPLGAGRTLPEGWLLEMKLFEKPPGRSSQIRLSLERAVPEVDLIVLRVPRAGGSAPSAWVVTRTGERLGATVQVDSPPDFSSGLPESLVLGSLQVRNGAAPFPGEWWCDVSMLMTHSRPDAHSFPVWSPELSWNWLFTGSGHSDPSVAVSHPALRGMTEAQARIINVSPPIPVMMEI